MLQASLKVIGGKNDGKLIEFRTSKFLVGREQDCHLRPNSDLVSRHHCVFSVDDYAVRLRDLGSTNGTLVNGRRIRGETVLTGGDIVKIGKLNLEIVIGNPAPGEAPPRTGAHLETTTNATALDTAHEMPKQTTLDDSGMLVASSPNDSTQFEMPIISAEGELDSGEPDIESETVFEESTVYQPVEHAAPEPPAQAPPQYINPADYPQSQQPNWQYPQYYPPQYPQYPGYPMGYPPQGFPPGYGYPPQQAYPQQGVPQQPQPNQPGSDSQIPEVRLPDPADTGVKEEPPKPAEGEAPKPVSNGPTPSQSAADMINSSRRRRRAEEE